MGKKETNSLFGDVLLQARQTLNMTQEEAAEAASMGVTSLMRMERGKPCNPSLRTLTAICAVYELDIGEMAALWVDSE